jgi:hypothetical protein
MAKARSVLSTDQLERLRDALSQIAGDDTAYPITMTQLFERAALPTADEAMKAIAAGGAVAKYVRVAAKKSKKAPDVNALAFLPGDEERVAGTTVLWTWAIRQVTNDKTNIVGSSALSAAVPSFLHKLLARRIKDEDLPPGVGMLRIRGNNNVFLMGDVVSGTRRAEPRATVAVPSKDVSPSEFEHDFRTAFERLDSQTGRHNYVLLHDLRLALPGVPRREFDERLNDLRRNKLFSLDSADGRQMPLTAEQLEAGIREANSLLVYVARR